MDPQVRIDGLTQAKANGSGFEFRPQHVPREVDPIGAECEFLPNEQVHAISTLPPGWPSVLIFFGMSVPQSDHAVGIQGRIVAEDGDPQDHRLRDEDAV